MRVVVIGGSGHIGTYLVPQLVEAGHEVVSISRGRREPYQRDPAWDAVRRVSAERNPAIIRELSPDTVVDLICFHEAEARDLVAALRGVAGHLLHCGSIWVYGPSVRVPTTEAQPRTPVTDYGRGKAAIESYLLSQSDVPATVLHPGHLVGSGWAPINPAGHLDLSVFAALAAGDEVALPHLGMDTLHHVHAEDVARAFTAAVARPDAATGESFNVVSPAALTMRGYAEHAARWFGREARLTCLPWPEWSAQAGAENARVTWDHLVHSPISDIGKARRLLGYQPRESLTAVREAVGWLIDHGRLPARFAR